MPALLAARGGLNTVEALRAALGLLPDDHAVAPHLRVAGAVAVFTAALLRNAAGQEAIAPDGSLGQSADFLRMLRGSPAAAAEVAALDAYLVTVADHGMNASTFAARVIASTQAGIISAAIGGLCALKGPLHGGAPGPVLDMLDAIGTAENIEPWLDQALAGGERLMGFGHRIYRVRDPRADVLKAALERLIRSGAVDTTRVELAQQVETVALAALKRHKPDRVLATNVEFYPALLLETLGFPRSAFTAIFAASRIGGWIAHAREEAANGRLIRPKSLYVGPVPRVAA